MDEIFMSNFAQIIEILLVVASAATIILFLIEAKISRAEGKTISSHASSLVGFLSAFLSSFYFIVVVGQFNWAVIFLTALNIILFVIWFLRAWQRSSVD